MGFLDKVFGKTDPLEKLRRLLQQKRWAEALSLGDEIEPARLTDPERAELDRCLAVAGDALAEINLVEGEACLRAGDPARAREHFSLAAGQARTPGMKDRLRTAPLVATAVVPPVAAPGAQACCPAGCGSGSADDEPPFAQPDAQTHFELTLAGYPSALAERYRQGGETFREAVLLAHAGDDARALERIEQVPPGEREALFYFERGCLLGRLGLGERALRDLETACTAGPAHPLALETLVGLELAMGRDQAAENRLRTAVEGSIAPAFRHGRLAMILARRGDRQAALGEAEIAIAAGNDPEALQLAAALLENSGRLEEAEGCLARLGGAGCGSHNLPLAEFWLRHNIHLDRALEAFKGGLRQKPDEPRWNLRIAQVYLAKGWRREGLPLLEKVLANPDLDPLLRREGEALLSASG